MNKKLGTIFGILLLCIFTVSAITLDAFGVWERKVSGSDAIQTFGNEDEDVEIVMGDEIISSERSVASLQENRNIPLYIENRILKGEEEANDVLEESYIRFLLDAESIIWEEDGYLSADFEAGREEVTILTPEMTLGDLDTLSYEQYVEEGYPVSINILLDSDNDGNFNPKKDLTTGYLTEGNDAVIKGEWAHQDNHINNGYNNAYMTEDDYNIWTEIIFDDDSNLWLYENMPGGEGFNEGTLSEFKDGINRGNLCYYVDDSWKEEECEDITIDENTPIYGIQIESLGFIAESHSKVRNIKINGENIEVTLLPLRSFDFDVYNLFRLDAEGGEYTLRTIVSLRE